MASEIAPALEEEETHLQPAGGADPEGGRANVDAGQVASSGGDPSNRASGSGETSAPAVEDEQAPVRGKSEILQKWRALGDNRTVVSFLLCVGTVCSACSPLFFTSSIWPVMIGPFIYMLLCLLGYLYRETNVLRRMPNMFVQTFCIVLSIGLTIYVGVSFETSEQDIIGFMVLVVATFCWTQIAQPSFDYGVLQLVTCIPMQIVIVRAREPGARFKPWYVLTGVLPLICLLGQAFFVQYFNDTYIGDGTISRQLH